MQALLTSTDAVPIPFWSALIKDRRIAPALGLGFTSGMPFLLTYSTQSAWLTDAAVPLATIGLLSELTLAYKFKFVWAPFLDQYDPPLMGRVLGRRRGWLLVAILAVMAILAGIAFGDPGHWIWWTVGFSFALGIAGATLDLVLDGWRITSVRPPEKQAVLSAWTEIGWRVGNLVAGAGALYLADQIGWKGAYLCMAALMLVGSRDAIEAVPGLRLCNRLLLAHHDFPLRCGNLVAFGWHSGLWPAESPVDLWSHGLVCLSEGASAE